MAAPPGDARIPSSTRSNNFSGIEDLKVTARTILWNCGIDYGPNKINRLCVEFSTRVQRNGFDFFDFLANKVELTAEQRRNALSNPDLQKVIAYSDPVGEEAVNNVMRRARTNKVETPACSAAPAQVPQICVEDLVPDPSELEDIYAMAAVSNEQFEEVLAEARADGDLSRANVARKCRARASR